MHYIRPVEKTHVVQIRLTEPEKIVGGLMLLTFVGVLWAIGYPAIGGGLLINNQENIL